MKLFLVSLSIEDLKDDDQFIHIFEDQEHFCQTVQNFDF